METGKKGADTDRLTKSEDYYTPLAFTEAAARPLDSYRIQEGDELMNRSQRIWNG